MYMYLKKEMNMFNLFGLVKCTSTHTGIYFDSTPSQHLVILLRLLKI